MYIYPKLEYAISDLKLFSTMTAHEDKPCYLVRANVGWYIEYRYPLSYEVEAIAINGTLFVRKD